MENFNNIDQLFNEESKKTEENTEFPRFENVWEKVEARLDQVENKKKIFPIWLPYSIAASLAITVGLVYFLNQKTEINTVNIASNNVVKNSVNQSVGEISDTSEITKIDETVKQNISDFKKTESAIMRTSTAQNIMPKVVSNQESVKPVFVENAEAFEVNPNEINEIASSKINEEKQMQEAKNALLESSMHQKEEVVKTFAMKETKTRANNIQNIIPEENHVTLAESTDVSEISDDEDFSNVKIAMNKNSQPLYIIDGYVADAKFLKNYNVKKITSLNIVEGENAVHLYGNSGKKGVVVITTKGLTSQEKQKLKELSVTPQ